MQTFLPFPSFVKSMECLDNRRLGKQRVEACQILEILLDCSILPKNLDTVVPFDRKFNPWHRHPAVQMWSGHEEWLKKYLDIAIGEWRYRGYSNNIQVPPYSTATQEAPSWLGYYQFHLSHRANLIRKFAAHYTPLFPKEDIDLSMPYFWPTLEGFDVRTREETVKSPEVNHVRAEIKELNQVGSNP